MARGPNLEAVAAVVVTAAGSVAAVFLGSLGGFVGLGCPVGFVGAFPASATEEMGASATLGLSLGKVARLSIRTRLRIGLGVSPAKLWIGLPVGALAKVVGLGRGPELGRGLAKSLLACEFSSRTAIARVGAAVRAGTIAAGTGVGLRTGGDGRLRAVVSVGRLRGTGVVTGLLITAVG